MRMNKELRVLLVGQNSPILHGQSIQYAALLGGSQSWSGIHVEALNTVYAESRDALSSFSLRKLFRMVAYAGRMYWKAHRQKTDIIVLSLAFHKGPFLKDSLFILLAKYVCRAQVIGWIHMDPNRLDWDRQPRWFQKYASWVVSKMDRLVSCAPSLSANWPEWLLRTAVVSVPNGVKDEGVGFSRKREGSCRVGYLSSMDPEKGWRELFAAALKMCDQDSDIEFHFYGGLGSGDSQKAIEKQFADQPFGKRIVWHGATWGENKSRAYQEMDLYCFPSHTEAFPLSVLEAMSFSLPIVSTDVGAIKDAMVSDQGGWYCKPGDEESLLLVLSQALESQNQWLKMGEYNRKRYLEDFSSEVFVECWHDLLLHGE